MFRLTRLRENIYTLDFSLHSLFTNIHSLVCSAIGPTSFEYSLSAAQCCPVSFLTKCCQVKLCVTTTDNFLLLSTLLTAECVLVSDRVSEVAAKHFRLTSRKDRQYAKGEDRFTRFVALFRLVSLCPKKHFFHETKVR